MSEPMDSTVTVTGTSSPVKNKGLDFQSIGLIDGDYIIIPRDARVDRVKFALDLMQEVGEDDYDPLASVGDVVEAMRRHLA